MELEQPGAENQSATVPVSIEGRFELFDCIGRGGMGTVYRGLQLPLGRRVAVKLIRPELAQDRQAQELFQQEAQAASSLYHPGIAQIHDYGITDSGTPFIAMEFVEGRPLHRAWEAKPPLASVLRLADAVLGALAASHDRGVVHRDLKPANILVVEGGDTSSLIKLVDFGIASVSQQAADPLAMEEAGTVVEPQAALTPAYAAPELCRPGGKSGPASDLYSLGVILFELTTGRRPIWDADPAVLIRRKVRERAPACQFDPRLGYPVLLAAFIDSLLEPDPQNRPRSASLLRLRLREIEAVGSKPHTLSALPDPSEALVERFGVAAEAASPTDLPEEPPETGEGPILGRVKERRDLVSFLNQSIAQSRGAIAWISGPPGIGRSRLLRWTMRIAPSIGFRWVGAGVLRRDNGVHALRQALEHALGTNDLHEQDLRKTVGDLLAVQDGGVAAHPVSSWLRPESLTNHGAKLSGAACLERLVDGMGRKGPLLILLDDVQRAAHDPRRELQGLLDQLLRVQHPVCVVCTALEAHGVRPPLGARRLQLAPLEQSPLKQLVRSRWPLQEREAELIADHAEGNPQHATAVIDGLVRQKGVGNDKGGELLPSGVRVDGRLGEALTTRVVRRIGQELEGFWDTEEALGLLARVAMLGREVPVSLLRETMGLSGDSTNERAEQKLSAVISSGVLEASGSGDPTLRFRSTVARDAVLAWGRNIHTGPEFLAAAASSLRKRQARKQGLSPKQRERLADLLETLGELELAGQGWWEEARAAVAASDLPKAARAYAEAVRCFDAAGVEEDLLGPVLIEAAGVLRQRLDLTRANRMCERLTRMNEPSTAVMGLLGLAEHALIRGGIGMARALVRRARARVMLFGDTVSHQSLPAVSGPNDMAAQLTGGVELDSVRDVEDRTLLLPENMAGPGSQATDYITEMVGGGEDDVQLDLDEDEPTLIESLDGPVATTTTYLKCLLAEAHCARSAGEIDLCETLARDVTSRTDEVTLLADASQLLAQVLMYRGKYQEAVQQLGRSVEFFEAASDEHGIRMARTSLGYTLVQAGDKEGGMQQLRRACGDAASSGDLEALSKGQGSLAAVLLTMGDPSTAVEVLQDLLATQRTRLGNKTLGRSLNNLGEAYRRDNRLEEAKFSYQAAHEVHRFSGARLGQIVTSLNVAIVELQRGESGRAAARLRRACTEAEELGAGTVFMVASALLTSHLLEHENDLEAVEEAVQLLDAAEDREWQYPLDLDSAEALARAGRKLGKLGRPEQARYALNSATDIFEKLGDQTRADGLRLEMVKIV